MNENEKHEEERAEASRRNEQEETEKIESADKKDDKSSDLSPWLKTKAKFAALFETAMNRLKNGSIWSFLSTPLIIAGYLLRATLFGDPMPFAVGEASKRQDAALEYKELVKKHERLELEKLRKKDQPERQEQEKSQDAPERGNDEPAAEKKQASARPLEEPTQFARDSIRREIDKRIADCDDPYLKAALQQIDPMKIVVRENDAIPHEATSNAEGGFRFYPGLEKACAEIAAGLAEAAEKNAEALRAIDAAKEKSDDFIKNPPKDREAHLKYIDDAAQRMGVAREARREAVEILQNLGSRFGNSSLAEAYSGNGLSQDIDDLMATASLSVNELFREMEERGDGRTRDEILMSGEKIPHIESVRYLDAGEDSTYYDRIEITTQPGATISVPAASIDDLPLAMASADKFIERTDDMPPLGYEARNPFHSLSFIAGNEDIKEAFKAMEPQFEKTIYDRHKDEELAKSINLDEIKREIFKTDMDISAETSQPAPQKSDRALNAFEEIAREYRSPAQEFPSIDQYNVSPEPEAEYQEPAGSGTEWTLEDMYDAEGCFIPEEQRMTPEVREMYENGFETSEIDGEDREAGTVSDERETPAQKDDLSRMFDDDDLCW
jgi:hypothetical protein